MYHKGIFKKLQAVVLLLICCCVLSYGEVKIVHLPEDIKVEENVAKETVIRNLTEDYEIFRAHPLFLIDGYFYMSRIKPVEVIKFSLDGKIVGRAGRKGEGPGEIKRVWTIGEYNGNIVLLDFHRMKIIQYSKDLRFIKEKWLPKKHMYMGFLVDSKNRFILYGEARPMADYYYFILTEEFEFLRSFGETKASAFSGAERKKKGSLDSVKKYVIIPEQEGIWSSFMNRYELRYYVKEKLAVAIKAPKDFFRGEEAETQGRKYTHYHGRSVQLARFKNNLYHFYHVEKVPYCDIFDLSTHRLLRRVKLGRRYVRVLHFKKNIFYGLGYELDEVDEDYDVVLYKFEL